jgi:hypothetical protein
VSKNKLIHLERITLPAQIEPNLELFRWKKERLTTGSGSVGKGMASASRSGLTAVSTKGSGETTRVVGRESLFMLTGTFTRVIGRMIKLMEKVSIST